MWQSVRQWVAPLACGGRGFALRRRRTDRKSKSGADLGSGSIEGGRRVEGEGVLEVESGVVLGRARERVRGAAVWWAAEVAEDGAPGLGFGEEGEDAHVGAGTRTITR